jgi:pantothenate kinase
MSAETRSAKEMRRRYPDLYEKFSREQWAKLRANMPLEISHEDLDELRGLNDPVSLDEVETIYLPLGRLLNIHIATAHGLERVKDSFLGHHCCNRERCSGQEHVLSRAGPGALALG